MYILNPYEEGYILRYKYEKTIYVYMLIRYYTHNIKKRSKIRDVTVIIIINLWNNNKKNMNSKIKVIVIIKICL